MRIIHSYRWSWCSTWRWVGHRPPSLWQKQWNAMSLHTHTVILIQLLCRMSSLRISPLLSIYSQDPWHPCTDKANPVLNTFNRNREVPENFMASRIWSYNIIALVFLIAQYQLHRLLMLHPLIAYYNCHSCMHIRKRINQIVRIEKDESTSIVVMHKIVVPHICHYVWYLQQVIPILNCQLSP